MDLETKSITLFKDHGKIIQKHEKPRLDPVKKYLTTCKNRQGSKKNPIRIIHRSRTESWNTSKTYISIYQNGFESDRIFVLSICSGYGYGLPLSRLYARYLLGDLTVTSCEGYGTDAYISLKAITKDANEMLPVFNHSSTRYYRTPLPHRDWVSNNPAARAFWLVHSVGFISPRWRPTSKKFLSLCYYYYYDY